MAETNQLLLNYYKKEEIKKIQQLSKEKASLKTILSRVDLNFITKEEVLEILGEDYEQEIEDIKDTTENDFNTSSVIKNTPIEKAKELKKCYEQYNKNRVLVCKEKNIGNGTLQKYLRLNYLIPELQDLVNQKKLGLNSAEHISFIDNTNQFIISKIIENYNYNITDRLAQRIKEDYYNCRRLEKEYILSKDKIDKYQNEKRIKVRFTQEEIERYFKGIDKKMIKEYIIDVLENTRRV